MFNGFKEFILRGNVIDLAVAVVIGAAFTAVVTAIVTGIFNPIISAIFQSDTLNDALDVHVGSATIKFGLVLGAIIQFLIVALVVYFVFVLPINHLKKVAFFKNQQSPATEAAAATPPTEAELLTEIRDLLAAQRSVGAVTASQTPAGPPFPNE
ncbi:large conductance mechanosensitive channel protein MscL [Subtercola boreus]|uniref:Large-conductance mechanosensitive channel n=1 Tax=Subtercola boreus TaxID=120213 RepID=A0A3E0WAP5_9MICO|nr:large conductance mechanosensitive channel protein MscL [Subtercola boreus]RFA19288.1 mechanosensitive ion channel protein MscL [Subtercola boreus]RFA19548.1 mechanosensitive ion channel protein MscL [Subtercola boreus]RFA25914.1 mechanosensitive ion channel protein MscL [Subtercola boreus]